MSALAVAQDAVTQPAITHDHTDRVRSHRLLAEEWHRR